VGAAAFGRVNGVFSAPVTAVIALAPGDALLADLFGFPTAYTVLAVLTLLGSALVSRSRGAPGRC